MEYVKDEEGNIYQVTPDGGYSLVQPVRQIQNPQAQKAPGLLDVSKPVLDWGFKQGVNSLIGPSGVTEATQAAWNTGAGEAAQAAWNAGADAATGVSNAGTGVAETSGGLGLGTLAGGLAALHGGYNLATNLGHLGGRGGAASGAELGGGIGTMVLPGIGTAIGTGLGALAGWGLSAFDHESTKDVQKKRTQELLSMEGANPQWQKDVMALREGQDDGKGWTAEVAAKALKDPTSMWGASGILKTFGPDYLQKMSEPQRYSIAKYAIDNNLLDPEKGVINVTDPNKLKAGYQDAISNKDYEKEYWKWKDAETEKTRRASLKDLQPQG